MLSWDIKVATAQGAHEIAWITQATEKAALATKNLARFFREIGEVGQIDIGRSPASPDDLAPQTLRSLPFIALDTAIVVSSEALVRDATHQR